jgi:hypothetical protein
LCFHCSQTVVVVAAYLPCWCRRNVVTTNCRPHDKRRQHHQHQQHQQHQAPQAPQTPDPKATNRRWRHWWWLLPAVVFGFAVPCCCCWDYCSCCGCSVWESFGFGCFVDCVVAGVLGSLIAAFIFVSHNKKALGFRVVGFRVVTSVFWFLGGPA